MASASVLASRSGRTLALTVGLLLGGLWLGPETAPAKDPTAPKPAASSPTSDGGETVRLINEKLAEQWKVNKITPSARCSDHEFIRRASLDIIGRIARADELQRFLKDPPETRRRLLIDRLLASDEYARNWANIWTVWLMTRAGALEENRKYYHEQMHLWLEEQFAKANVSWKDVVTELITATGKTNENGAVNFILTHLGEPIPQDKRREEGHFEMVPVTSRTTKLFLGLQTQCTQCHDHPFNPEWKQSHFWGINAFFRQVDTDRRLPQMRRDQVAVITLRDDPSLNREGIVYYEKRNGVVLPTRPTFIDGTKIEPENGTSRRQALALFLTRSEYFPKAYVNRMWGHFFGRGFTNPVDDFGEHNPVSNPELLDELAKHFVQYGYNPQRLIRWICNSEAYGLSSVANKSNEKSDADPYFSRMLLKAMTPEQLFESLLIATGAEAADTKERKKERKEQRDRWMRSLITNFGDDEGNEVTFNGTVVQALLMMNGKDITDAIAPKERGTVALAYLRGHGTNATLNDLYLAALNRPPTAEESRKIMGIIRTAPVKNRADRLAPWQDVFWALLNSNEFILNH